MNYEILTFIGIVAYSTFIVQTAIWSIYWMYGTKPNHFYWWAHPFVILLCIAISFIWPYVWVAEFLEWKNKQSSTRSRRTY